MSTSKPLTFNPKPINVKFIESGMIDPTKLDRTFFVQRDIQSSRKKIIEKSMGSIGYDMAKPIVLWGNVIIDGNHRTDVALDYGYKEIPFVRYDFKTKNDAYRYFQLSQIQTAGMKARDEMFAYYQTNHPYAQLIYKLCDNKKSLLCGCHDLKVAPGDKSLASNIKVENLCYIINNIIFGRITGWSRTNADHLANLAINVISNVHETHAAIIKLNDFMRFFWDSFGWKTEKKELIYREHFILAVMEIFNEFLIVNPIFVKDRKNVQSKLLKIKVNKELITNHKDTIRSILLKEINKNRTKKERIYC